MKLVAHHLKDILNVDIYAIIPLLIFVTFFIILTIRVVKIDKSKINELSQMPLDDDHNATDN